MPAHVRSRAGVRERVCVPVYVCATGQRAVQPSSLCVRSRSGHGAHAVAGTSAAAPRCISPALRFPWQSTTWRKVHPRARAHTRTHARTHTHTHTHTHTNTQTHSAGHDGLPDRADLQVREEEERAAVPKGKHTRAHAHTRAHSQALTRTHAHARTQEKALQQKAHTHARTRTHARTHARTHTRSTHERTHTR
jgi:hypothetical protein